MADRSIFLSHSSKDNAIVTRLAKDLRSAGFNIWIDLEAIQDGDRWVQRIQDGVTECSAFVVLMSKNARESEWVERESLLALSLRKPLFIAQMEDVPLPLQLINRQYTNFYADYHDGLDHLIEALRRSIAETAGTDVEEQGLPQGISPDPNEDNFFAYLRQMPAGKQLALIAHDLYTWAKSQADTIRFGGRNTPCFHAQIQVADKLITVFSVLAYMRTPSVQIPFDYLKKYAPYTNEAARLAFLQQLNQLLPEDERLKAERANRRPTLPLLAAFDTVAGTEDFKHIVAAMIAQLKQRSA